ncbi:amino acid adenylation domain-containing protein [Streptomyces sp. NPDC002138]|uniref:amino acid adenylation domain-containing protein n=1 Tax=Streptomyces sp. NPDC002138 TaxID=3154410 RepID=UPI003325050E
MTHQTHQTHQTDQTHQTHQTHVTTHGDATSLLPAHWYRRPVSATERLYLAAGDPRGAMALRIVIEGDGLPDPDRLRAALARAAEACPGSRLVRTGAQWRAEGPPPRLRHAAPADPHDGVLDATLLTGHTHRGDPPGCEVLVVPGLDPARSTLVFSASHALMDGHGALLWVREVFRALRDEPPRPAHSPETDQGLLHRLNLTSHRPTPPLDRPSPLAPAAPSPRATSTSAHPGRATDTSAPRAHAAAAVTSSARDTGGSASPGQGAGGSATPVRGTHGPERALPPSEGTSGFPAPGRDAGSAFPDQGAAGSATPGRVTHGPERTLPLGEAAAGSAAAGSAARGPVTDGGERTLWLRRTVPGHHPALTARLAQALADATGRAARVMIPADLRRYDPDMAATGNLTLPLFLDLRPDTEWTVAHTRLLTALAEGRECATGFESVAARLPRAATALLLRAAQAAATRTDRYLATAVVSHLGRLDLDEYRGGGFTATALHALPVHAPLVPISLVAAETGSGAAGTARTEVTMGVRGGGATLAVRAAHLLDATLTHITAPAPRPAVRVGPTPDPDAASGPRTASTPGPGDTSASPPARAQGSAPGTTPATAPPPPPGPTPVTSPPVRAGATPDPDAAQRGAPAPTVVDLFRARAARTPYAHALDGPDGVLTYAALDQRSDAVAAALRGLGIGREDPVALVVERSPAGVAALWGILKAGAAYLPLDPAHPDARIAEVLRDSGARLCLTQRHLLDRLAGFVPCPALAAEDVPDLPDLPDGSPPPAPGPAAADLAYVMHTSGSTGRPKGVRIEHGSLVGFVRWMTGLCQVTETTRFGFVSSYAFDISCFPLFLPLLAGGTAVLAPGAPSRATLRRLVTEHRADTLALTPSHLPLLTPGGAVRTLLLGGETLTPAAVRAARTAFGPDCRIINGYGPTEATVACLAHVVTDDDVAADAVTIPLGTPGPYARVDLVAADGTPLHETAHETGQTGEIVVTGPQIARGYLGDHDAPAERNARPSPSSPFFTLPDGTRGYRTGDLGRWLPGGAIAFAGRVDGQLKIAGHRVEPAETVAALEAHPAVRRAVVAARRRTDTAAPVLCAYVVPRVPCPATGQDTAPATGQDTAPATAPDIGPATNQPTAPDLPALLRADLARRLPAHLVPAHLVLVEAIPSGVSGKADLDALPDPFGHPTPDPVAPYPAAADPLQDPHRDPLRSRVAEHWAAVLGTDAAGLAPGADFQDLGGDSLALIEMLTAVSSDLLTRTQADHFMARLESLVRNVTLEQVCAHIEAAREEVPA